MSVIAYRIFLHVLALGVFAIYWVNIRRELKLGTALSELKIYLLGLIISGLLVIYTAATVIMALMTFMHLEG